MPRADVAMRDGEQSPVSARRFSSVPRGWYYAGPVESPRRPTEVMLVDRCYVALVIGGHLFFHTNTKHSAPMPFFADVRVEELVSAPPFSFDVEMP